VTLTDTAYWAFWLAVLVMATWPDEWNVRKGNINPGLLGDLVADVAAALFALVVLLLAVVGVAAFISWAVALELMSILRRLL